MRCELRSTWASKAGKSSSRADGAARDFQVIFPLDDRLFGGCTSAPSSNNRQVKASAPRISSALAPLTPLSTLPHTSPGLFTRKASNSAERLDRTEAALESADREGGGEGGGLMKCRSTSYATPHD